MINKPYLLSVGIGFPMAGIWVHHYFDVKKKYKQKSIKKLGITIIWTTYKKSKGD